MAPGQTPEERPPFVAGRPGGCTLRVRVVPRAGRTALAGTRGDALVVRLAAAPVDGEANAALVTFLATTLGLPRRQVTLVAGDRGRDKRLEVDGLDAATVASRLAFPALSGSPARPT